MFDDIKNSSESFEKMKSIISNDESLNLLNDLTNLNNL